VHNKAERLYARRLDGPNRIKKQRKVGAKKNMRIEGRYITRGWAIEGRYITRGWAIEGR
jgi:hypothetical protein